MSAVDATAVRARRLDRSVLGDRPAPPVRIVHLGLGAFHRAHQAWYTWAADDADAWGIHAVTGHSTELADRLTEQQGVYTLVVRDHDDDRVEVVGSIVRASSGRDIRGLVDTIAAPTTAIATLTVTEAAYRLLPTGALDLADPVVAADLETLRRHPAPSPATPLAQLVAGLDRRRTTGAGGLAIIPCDNLRRGGSTVRAALLDLADAWSPALAAWIAAETTVVSTSVDRITPRTTPELEHAAEATSGDRAPVLTEPFSDWVLSGDFPAGRPHWEGGGARFVDGIEQWESRKLWMLNGAHSLLAALGALRGHGTVADAVADDACRRAVDDFWDECERHLAGTGDLAGYRRDLLRRFGNPRLEHRLEQIREGEVGKLQARVVPVALRERRAGRPARGCAVAVAAWANAVARGRTADAVAHLDPELGADTPFVATVDAARPTLPAQRNGA